MSLNTAGSFYKSLIKAISFAAALMILFWFLYNAAGAVLLLLFALVLAIVINAPVARLESKGMKRVWACLIVFGLILLAFGLLGWLIVPKISEQVTTLINNLPAYAAQLSKNLASLFEDYPQLHTEIQAGGISLSQWLPSLPSTLMRIGNYSLSLFSGIFIGIIFISMVVYAVTSPRPLLQLYFSFFPAEKHDKATVAMQYTATMLNGWMQANLIGGSIRAVCFTIFLTLVGVPGAWVWGALAFFAELIPKLGFYIASIPPILVALSVSPMTALWVTVFILLLDSLIGDFILPKVRSKTMNIHPVSILFIFLAMAAVFGTMGALLATPLTAIIKAFYETFLISRFKEDATLEERIDSVLYKKKTEPEKKPA